METEHVATTITEADVARQLIEYLDDNLDNLAPFEDLEGILLKRMKNISNLHATELIIGYGEKRTKRELAGVDLQLPDNPDLWYTSAYKALWTKHVIDYLDDLLSRILLPTSYDDLSDKEPEPMVNEEAELLAELSYRFIENGGSFVGVEIPDIVAPHQAHLAHYANK